MSIDVPNNCSHISKVQRHREKSKLYLILPMMYFYVYNDLVMDNGKKIKTARLHRKYKYGFLFFSKILVFSDLWQDLSYSFKN